MKKKKTKKKKEKKKKKKEKEEEKEEKEEKKEKEKEKEEKKKKKQKEEKEEKKKKEKKSSGDAALVAQRTDRPDTRGASVQTSPPTDLHPTRRSHPTASSDRAMHSRAMADPSFTSFTVSPQRIDKHFLPGHLKNKILHCPFSF